MIKKILLVILVVLLWAPGCQKYECYWIIPARIHFDLPELDKIWTIDLHIYQGDRILMGDILKPWHFNGITFDHTYPVPDYTGDSLTITRKIYTLDHSWRLVTDKLPVR